MSSADPYPPPTGLGGVPGRFKIVPAKTPNGPLTADDVQALIQTATG